MKEELKEDEPDYSLLDVKSDDENIEVEDNLDEYIDDNEDDGLVTLKIRREDTQQPKQTDLSDEFKYQNVQYDPVTKKFNGPDCDYSTKRGSNMNRHYKYKHLFENCCHICGEKAGSKNSLEKHMKLHNFASPDAPYGQDIQGYADVSFDKKEGRKFKCKHCDFEAKDLSSFSKHCERKHFGLTVIACNVCGKTAKTMDALKSHKNIFHSLDGLRKCTNCKKAFPHEDFSNHECNKLSSHSPSPVQVVGLGLSLWSLLTTTTTANFSNF